MKMILEKDYKALTDWMRNARGYAVVKLSNGTQLKDAKVDAVVRLVRVSANPVAAIRELERIREVYDIDPLGMRPRLVVVPATVADTPLAFQFMRRAAVIVEA